MRISFATLWMPALRRSGISAFEGRSVSIGRAYVVDGVQPMALALKEGET